MTAPVVLDSAYFQKRVAVDQKSGCWNWLLRTSSGYGSISVKGVKRRAHRVSYEVHVGPVPGDAFVCHRCDNKICVNPEHLFLGTPAENSADMVAKGRAAAGVRNGKATVTPDKIAEVLRLRGVVSGREIARRTGVSYRSIKRAFDGEQWALETAKAEVAVRTPDKYEQLLFDVSGCCSDQASKAEFDAAIALVKKFEVDARLSFEPLSREDEKKVAFAESIENHVGNMKVKDLAAIIRRTHPKPAPVATPARTAEQLAQAIRMSSDIRVSASGSEALAELIALAKGGDK